MIYSDGNRHAIQGGKVRWEIAYDVLNLSKRHFEFLENKYKNSIEYQVNKEYPQAFPYFRFLKNDDSY